MAKKRGANVGNYKLNVEAIREGYFEKYGITITNGEICKQVGAHERLIDDWKDNLTNSHAYLKRMAALCGKPMEELIIKK